MVPLPRPAQSGMENTGMAQSQKMRGVYAAPQMPMTADLAADIPRYLDHCRWLLAQGCDGLMPLGSTGEAHSFTVDERIAVIDALAASDLGMSRMLVGTSALAMPDAVRLIRHAVAAGAGRVCVQPAFYYKPTDDGLYTYYARLVEQVNDDRLRLLIYDWAANTGVAFSLEVLDRLFTDFAGTIVGIKDSNADAELVQARGAAFPDIELFSGADGGALATMRAGGCGIMSATANVIPGHICAIYRDFASPSAAAVQAEVDALSAVLKTYSFFAAMKELTTHRTGDANWRRVRPPLIELTEAAARALAREVATVGYSAAA